MKTHDATRFAFDSLRAYRTRTLLMLLAMSIGVASVLVLTSLGEAARRYVTGEFSSLGTNLVIVLPGKSETAGTGPASFFVDTAREIFSYVLRDMTAPGGAFYSSEDADSAGVEGNFYLWSAAAINSLLGAGEGADHRPGVLELDRWSPGQKCNVLVRFPYTEKSFAVGHVPSLVEVP